MPDGLGLLHLVTEPFLERVARDQRITRDHPRKRKDEQGERGNENAAQVVSSTNGAEDQEAPMSSNHIDLRI